VAARLARIVELKVFGGMASGETAAVIGVSTRTVATDCKVARLWLKRLMAT
jgi:DNA-directed RNA polymerase specialized sigma24 family protein